MLSAELPPQQNCVEVFVSAAQQDSPVKIVGIEVPKSFGLAPKLRFRNTSDKRVASLRTQTLIERTGAEPSWREAGSETLFLGGPDVDDLAPEREMSFRWGSLKADVLASGSSFTQSHCFNKVVVISEITFSGGQRWKISDTQRKQALEAANWSECHDECHVTPIKSANDEGRDGGGHDGKKEVDDRSLLVKRYSLQCLISEGDDGKQHALCAQH
jgi:hypothetical protein